MIHQPKKTLLQFPGLWLPGSPLPGAMGFGRRCCCGGCPHCDGTSPDSLSLVFTGFIDYASCTDCDEDYAGPLVVPATGDAYEFGDWCVREYQDTFSDLGGCTNTTQITVTWQWYELSGNYLDIELYYGADGCGRVFRYVDSDTESPLSCDLEDFSVPYYSGMQPPCYGIPCLTTPAPTCEVTAL